eukprot:jgi/Antlo1/57/491
MEYAYNFVRVVEIAGVCIESGIYIRTGPKLGHITSLIL